jgi:hypothetical protein
MKPGDYVRFALLPPDCEAPPGKVATVSCSGTLTLEGKPGCYKTFLFVVVPPPESKAA